MLAGLPLRAGLRLADLLVGILPAPLAYGLADLAGAAWYRFAPDRRALVTENLRRVQTAIGRPSDPGSLRRLVRRAFVEHARYYLELLRAPHYPSARIDEFVSVDDWDSLELVLRRGAVIAVPHMGNFEPYGTFVRTHGLRAMAPVEEIEPRELFEFLLSRRGGGRANLVPLSKARRPMIEALRRGEIVGLVADRDLAGDGIPVTFFGHPTTMPSGPAALALMTGVPLLAAVCLRVGPDRFHARAWAIEVERTGDRHADLAALTTAMAASFEEAIALAPEQWWASFQPIWLDQRSAGGHA
jgi:phosphatidylinositol dimannoside acyltransferase